MDYYKQVFLPRYKVIRGAIAKTQLMILMWGPSGNWYRQRLEIRDELIARGHQIIFREDLGIPSGLVPPRAVDLTKGTRCDIAMVVKPSYATIGEVAQFADFRVVDSRLVIFIDEAAKDRRSYLPSVAQLQLLYNNIETFRAPDEVIKGQVLEMIVDKVGMFQRVKYLALQSARRWGLDLSNFSHLARGEDLQSFPHNLLELYRVHRHEVALLNDPDAFFLLALVDDVQPASQRLVVSDPTFQRKVPQLVTAGMLVNSGAWLKVTDLGNQILRETGFPASRRLIERSVPRPTPVVPRRTRYVFAGLVATFLILSVALIGMWFSAVYT